MGRRPAGTPPMGSCDLLGGEYTPIKAGAARTRRGCIRMNYG